MRRRVALIGALFVLLALAGCTGGVFGPGEPNQERLAGSGNVSYDWETNATVSLTVNRTSFTGVYDVSNVSTDNDSTLEVYRRDQLGQDQRLPIEALRFRYENGTVVAYNETGALSVSRTRGRTVVDLPNGTAGQVAFTAPRHGKRFTTPVFVEGSHEVTLPPGARVGVPILSQVSPRRYTTDVRGDRMTVAWENVTDQQLSVKYYLERDLLIFTGVVVVSIVVGSGGALYYYRQVRELKRRRERYGMDVDEDDDPRDRGPPPGMR